MSSISAIKAAQAIKNAEAKVVTPAEISKLLNLKNQNTIYKLIQRLNKYGLLERISKGKYVPAGLNLSEFEVANLIVTPSYVSFESALSFYGILPQFPYQITSATPLKSVNINSLNADAVILKEFSYSHLSAKMYWGYTKTNGFLIAVPEKALIDMMYLASKKLRKIDFDEMDFTNINKDVLKNMAKKINFVPFKRYYDRYTNFISAIKN